MGNNGSFMEKVYVYLPVLMCHSKMDYGDKTTMWNIRVAYFVEQITIFVFSAYFVFAIKRKGDQRKILVPDISHSQVLTNAVPKPDQLMYRQTTYFEHEMTEVFQQLQQWFVALVLTVMAHFLLDFRPILLLQIFSTPYHFVENRLFRKLVLGLKPGYRVWGERFDGELEAHRIREEDGVVAPAGDGEVADGTAAVGAGGSIPAADAKEVEVAGASVAREAVSAVGLPMPKALENALIDAWEAAGEADWSTVAEQLGPFSVNTQTHVGGWTPLMVACGLPQVGQGDIETLVSDLDARIDMQDEDGWTCIHWAAQQGRTEAVRAVFEGVAGLASEPSAAAATIAELSAVVDKNGKSAADVARDAGLEGKVLEELISVLSHGAGGAPGDSDQVGVEGLD